MTLAEKLAHLRGLLERATSGAWRDEAWSRWVRLVLREEDAALIAAAVNALPALLDVVEAARYCDTFAHWDDCDGGDLPEVNCTCGLARLRAAVDALAKGET